MRTDVTTSDLDGSPARPIVLYVVAKGRSGSNLLTHCLGQVPGVENTGELFQLWRRTTEPGRICGCGRPLADCPLWGPVTSHPDIQGSDIGTVVAWQDQVLRWTRAPELLARADHAVTREPVRSYVGQSAALYRRIAKVSSAAVIVDASKWPWDPAVLGLLPDVDVRVLHLVRDPRAVGYSWQRRKDWGDRPGQVDEMPRFGAAYSAGSWLARNLVTELARWRRPAVPWLRVRYEDFVADPAGTMREILAFAGLPGADVPVTGRSTVRLEPTHGIAGNASKFQRGDVQLRLDDEWQHRLRSADRIATTAIAWPLLARYGYRS